MSIAFMNRQSLSMCIWKPAIVGVTSPLPLARICSIISSRLSLISGGTNTSVTISTFLISVSPNTNEIVTRFLRPWN